LKIDSTPIEGLDIDLVNQEFKKELGGYQCEVALAIGYQHTEDYNALLWVKKINFAKNMNDCILLVFWRIQTNNHQKKALMIQLRMFTNTES
jgi:hypothetical protein